MRYTQLNQDDRTDLLKACGLKSVSGLFEGIPPETRVKNLLELPPPMSEPELLADLNALAARNRDTSQDICFLGAGAYDHFVPTIVDSLAAQNGFLTGYTPYQAEASQGTLQNFFEFQTMVCELTGLEVANASLYDGASAMVEAVMMARAVKRRPDVVVAQGVHPDSVQVLKTYLAEESGETRIAPETTGRINPMTLADLIDERTAAVVLQSPNFFGQIEDLEEIQQLVARSGALLIVIMDPISVGLIKRPGDCGADIVVAEGQPLGVPLQYGGPYLGLLACRSDYLRKMPGRIIGQTVDQQGRRAFCLTLQAREQHIRREKATSNVCTNQGLLATRAAIYMSALGKQGLSHIAQLCFHKAHYAAQRIAMLSGYNLRFDGPFFKEFTVVCDHPVDRVLAHCRAQGINAGVPLGTWYDEFKNCFLVAVTEQRTKAQIDQLIAALDSASEA
jgi:glycine dehydrogenase subunit 1